MAYKTECSTAQDVIRWEIYVKIFDFYILLFLIFNHDFVIYIDFTHVAASSTATYDVTNRSLIEF